MIQKQIWNTFLCFQLLRNVELPAWKMAYNGSEERWLVEESHLHPGKSYLFRVSAANSVGQGEFSNASAVFLASYGQ